MKNPKTEILKTKREVRKQILGGTESAHQRIYTEATKTRLAIKTEIFGAKSKGRDTKIELTVQKFLEENNIEYVLQKRIRYINVDFYIPKTNTVLQVNGDYWHVCPRCYPLGPKNEIQRKNLDKDIRTHEFVAEAKMKLIELWECDIEKDFENVKKVILENCK